MDSESHSILEELSQQNNRVTRNYSDQPVEHCALCQRIFSPENDMIEDLETVNICGDCKSMFLENIDATTRDSQQRSLGGRRTRRSRSSESIEDLFSQQFSHLINLIRQNQHTVPNPASEHGSQPADRDTNAIMLQHTSSRTTPNGSRRWRRVFSDNESEGYDNMDSIFGESESSVSFGGYGTFHGDNDGIYFSAYTGESDASMGGRSSLDRDMFSQRDDRTDIGSETDIDPMHAAINQWNIDGHDEEDEEWEEVDNEGNAVEIAEAENWIHDSFSSIQRESNSTVNWLREIESREVGGTIRWRMRESRLRNISNVLNNSEELEVAPYLRNSRDYLDARGFNELLEHLAENDHPRRGAPPAAVSSMNNLPCLVINEEHEKHGGLVCAVCKDPLSLGTEANQLPCLHIYHPSCILPWLSARNSCPLCRYELPTDDKDYEEGKRNSGIEMEIGENQRLDLTEDSSSDISSVAEAGEIHERHETTDQGQLVTANQVSHHSGREQSRGSWIFLAAAPLVSFVGIVLVFWFRNPLTDVRSQRSQYSIHEQGCQQFLGPSGSSSTHHQRDNRSRRWWSIF